MRAEGRKFDFDPPPNVRELSPIHNEIFGASFDIDYYTLANVSIGQFRAQEWVSHVLHLVRRDAGAFLRGR
jgi:hypothetical protein